MKVVKYGSSGCGPCSRMSHYDEKVVRELGLDFEYVKKIYGCSGELFECFMYPSNLSKNYTVNKNLKDTINIQVGNSADPTNNHMQVFDFLRKFKNDNIKNETIQIYIF